MRAEILIDGKPFQQMEGSEAAIEATAAALGGTWRRMQDDELMIETPYVFRGPLPGHHLWESTPDIPDGPAEQAWWDFTERAGFNPQNPEADRIDG